MTPLLSGLGGVLVGLGAALLLWSHGKIAGISGIVGGLRRHAESDDRGWRLMFLFGLVGVGALAAQLAPSALGPPMLPLLRRWRVPACWSGWVPGWAMAAPVVTESVASGGCRAGRSLRR